MFPAVVSSFIVFWLEPTQLSAELHVALRSCLHFGEFQGASSKHSPGKVSSERTHSIAARHRRKLFVQGRGGDGSYWGPNKVSGTFCKDPNTVSGTCFLVSVM